MGEIQVVHTVAELHAEQLVGQTRQKPFDKYLPVAHVEHNYVVEEVHFKQLYVDSQHSYSVDKV